MAWLFLILASFFEVLGAVALKASNGLTEFIPTIGVVTSMAVAIVFLGVAMRTLPMGSAYAIWTGIGVVSVAILGILVHGEPAGILKVGCIAMIVVGSMGLELTH